MKIIAISDTHGQHQSVKLPAGDMLIHAGDVSKRGTQPQVQEFLDWFSALDYRYKIFIAGNHDFYFEREKAAAIEALIPANIIYLNDSFVEIEKLKIWGSPVQPWFYDWAFNRQRGEDIRRHWKLIPEALDILITHGPVAGILDRVITGQHVGCEDLAERIRQVKPRVHICGHIHEAYGVETHDGIKYINASVLDEEYVLRNSPVVFEL